MGAYAPRYVCSQAAISVGSSTLPQGSIYAAAAVGFSLIEAGWFPGGATGGRRVWLYRLTSQGTPGSSAARAKLDPDSVASSCTVFGTHTIAPALGDRLHQMPVQNAIGSGIFFGFHDAPLEVPVGTANGVGIVPATAAGAADVTWVWEEG